MGPVHEVQVTPRPLALLAGLLPREREKRLADYAARAGEVLGGRVVWHVSSTASGGGVAEMLGTLLGYATGAGIENRWLVLDADPQFFALTKRLHNMLHGDAGDGLPLSAADHSHYEDVLATNCAAWLPAVSRRDIVLLHDPQTAGMAPAVRRTGAAVLWRCHVGRDEPNELTDAAWAFLRRYLDGPAGYVFSRRAYAPAWLDPDRLHVIPPSIDPFSPKNTPLDPSQVTQLLGRVGLLASPHRLRTPTWWPR